jgi:hypothetical protein
LSRSRRLQPAASRQAKIDDRQPFLLPGHDAAMWKAHGLRATSTSTHPAMIAARRRSPLWRMTRAPSMSASGDIIQHASTRLTAGFEYVGPPLGKLVAQALHA